jgi:DNA-binding IclR family transcriptional regulator
LDGRTDTGTLGKAMDVLEAVATASHPPRFTELLSQISQPRATLHRQLANLVEEGLLAVNRDHSYELGLRLLKLAAKAWSRNELRQVAEPHLARLHELTGETVHLAVLRGVEVIYLDKVESRQSVRMYSQVGNASPAYCTGVGKAALSALPDDGLDETLRNIRFRRFTDQTITTLSALRSELDAIRNSGVARDREEHEPGIRCIAAPIHSIDHSFVGGISVTGPAFRVPEDMLTLWQPLVIEAARAINDELGSRLGPRT